MTRRLLLVGAVTAECAAAARSLRAHASTLGTLTVLTADTPAGRVDLLAGGVGPAASAAATATALAAAPFDLVLSVGVSGGFPPAGVGSVVLASACIHADLGAESAEGFLPASTLGLGAERTELDPGLVAELHSTLAGALTTAVLVGPVLTVSTVTGTRATADALAARYPDACAEAMEGVGVLAAARLHGVPFGELRAISNAVGPRDRAAWQLGPALDALASAVAALTAAPIRSL